jgi:hypothetical protein
MPDLSIQSQARDSTKSQAFRFSGHQTFPLRIAWLPKAIQEIACGRDPLTNIPEYKTSPTC